MHSNVALSSLERSKLTTSDEGFGLIRVNVVWGGVRSITHEYVAGDPSVLPAASTARTAKVWLPALRVAVLNGEVQAA